MSNPKTTHLSHRGIVRISGVDAKNFLQGLVSNDVMKATSQKVVYAALLTPQGKFLHDLFIFEQDGALMLDVELDRADDLVRRLNAYKLRAKVTIENQGALPVWAIWDGSYEAPNCFTDPRLLQLGMRVYGSDTAPTHTKLADITAYDAHRMRLGIADGSRDMEVDKSTLAEGNIDILNGVDWKKGCYIGQELTARMHYRGLAKKRLFPVRIQGDLSRGLPVFSDQTEVGYMRSHNQNLGLALLSVETVKAVLTQNLSMTCGDAKIFPSRPDWMRD